MKVRFGISLGFNSPPVELAGDRRPLWRPAASTRCGSPNWSTPPRSIPPSAWRTRWPAPSTSKSARRSRCCRAGIRCWWPSSWRRWPRSRPSGFCRSSACARRFRPSAKSSPFPTASARRCSTSRCGCCARHWSTSRRATAARYFTVTAAAVTPRPTPPLDIWLGGSAPAAFRRIGTLADGWLGSFLTPTEAGAGRQAIERAAEEAGRAIEPDHFGISLAVADGELPPELAAAVRNAARTSIPRNSSPPAGISCTVSSTATWLRV